MSELLMCDECAYQGTREEMEPVLFTDQLGQEAGWLCVECLREQRPAEEPEAA